MSPPLATAAALERDRRQQTYPRQVAEGNRPAEDAQADYAAWHAIADWYATGSTDALAWLSWGEMTHAASRAWLALEEKLARAIAADAPAAAIAPIRARRDATHEIYAELNARSTQLDALNTALRARAQRERQAA